MVIEEGEVALYRARVTVSFKFEPDRHGRVVARIADGLRQDDALARAQAQRRAEASRSIEHGRRSRARRTVQIHVLRERSRCRLPSKAAGARRRALHAIEIRDVDELSGASATKVLEAGQARTSAAGPGAMRARRVEPVVPSASRDRRHLPQCGQSARFASPCPAGSRQWLPKAGRTDCGGRGCGLSSRVDVRCFRACMRGMPPSSARWPARASRCPGEDPPAMPRHQDPTSVPCASSSLEPP